MKPKIDIILKTDQISIALKELENIDKNNVNKIFIITFDKHYFNNNSKKIKKLEEENIFIKINPGNQLHFVDLSYEIDSDYTFLFYSLVPNLSGSINKGLEEIQKDDKIALVRYVAYNVYRSDIFQIFPFHELSQISDSRKPFHELEKIFLTDRLKMTIVDKKFNKIFQYKNKEEKKELFKGPIVIVGYGGRCGSTWIQRVISSHKDAFIWGEPRLTIEALMSFIKNINLNNENVFTLRGTKESENLDLKQSFPATTQPYSENSLFEETRRLVEFFFNRHNTKVWGFKTVVISMQFLSLMLTLFPEISFVGIKRKKENQLKSMRERKEWWIRLERTFEGWEKTFKARDTFFKILKQAGIPCILLQYEDLNGDLICQKLEELYNLPENSFSREVANTKVQDFDHAEKLRKEKMNV